MPSDLQEVVQKFIAFGNHTVLGGINLSLFPHEYLATSPKAILAEY